MVNGATGLTGQPALRRAAKDNKRERVPVQTHPQLTEENSVPAKLERHRIVTLNLAQVCYGV